jgi:uncharacterized membrane-anchored protein YitT (DUF2179 family)
MVRSIADILVIILGSLLLAIGFNLFFIPHLLLNGGISGIAMIIGYFTEWNIGIMYFLFNIPIMVWGYLVIGRRFVLLSLCSVFFTTIFMFLISPIYHPEASILGAVFGGVIVGIASGISLRIGGSSGGFDIVGSILTRKWDFPLGNVLFALNAVVILMLGYFKNNWDLALYSMLTIYISSKVIDAIHIRYLKVTVFIITKNKDLLLGKLLGMPRGITIVKTEGAFTQEQHDMLMTVTTKYELIELKKIISQLDPHAFVNIVETVGVLGKFRNLK